MNVRVYIRMGVWPCMNHYVQYVWLHACVHSFREVIFSVEDWQVP